MVCITFVLFIVVVNLSVYKVECWAFKSYLCAEYGHAHTSLCVILLIHLFYLMMCHAPAPCKSCDHHSAKIELTMQMHKIVYAGAGILGNHHMGTIILGNLQAMDYLLFRER